MNQALWAAIIAANICSTKPTDPVGKPWWADKTEPPMPAWPRLLLWLIRKQTQRRLLGKTWVKLDDWLWDKYFKAIERDRA